MHCPASPRSSRHFGLLSTALLLTTQLVAQNWAPSAAGNNGPSARSLSASAYDLGRKVTVLFGGREANGAASAETWEWNHLGWFRRSNTGPTPRLAHSLAYDSRRLRTVLFGGFDAAGSPIGDTWEWDGNNWALIQTTNAPAPRGAASVAYDSIRGRTVLFGGKSLGGALMNDTWEWNGFSWAQVSAAQAPSARQHAGMAFDNARGVCVLTCGEDALQARSDTWTYDGSNWTALNLGFEPGPRAAAQLVRDELSGDMLLVGGRSEDGANLYPDDWLWNGVAWTIPGSALPAPTHSVACSFDIHRGKFVVFGGQGTSGPVGETLVRSSSASRTISTLTPPRIGAPAVYHYAHPTSAAGNIQWMLLSPRFDSEFYLQVSGFVTVGDVRIDLSSILLDIPGILDNSGSKAVSIAIPDDASLLGFGFDLQSVEVDLRNERIYWSDNEANSAIAIGLQNLYEQVSNGQAQTFNTNEGAVVSIPAGAVPAGIPVLVGVTTAPEPELSDTQHTARGLQVVLSLPIDDMPDEAEIEVELPVVGFNPSPLDPSDPQMLNVTAYVEGSPGVGLDLPVSLVPVTDGARITLKGVVRVTKKVLLGILNAPCYIPGLRALCVTRVINGMLRTLRNVNIALRQLCDNTVNNFPTLPPVLFEYIYRPLSSTDISVPVLTPITVQGRICVIFHGMGQDHMTMYQLRRELAETFAGNSPLYSKIFLVNYEFQSGVERVGNNVRNIMQLVTANEIDFVAFNMGGLVARWAMEMRSSPAWRSSSGQISRFVTLGTPHEGLPPAVLRNVRTTSTALECRNQHLVELASNSSVIQQLRNSTPSFLGTKYYTLAGNNPNCDGYLCYLDLTLQGFTRRFYTEPHDGFVTVRSAASSTLASKGIYMGPGPQAAQFYYHTELHESYNYIAREIASRLKEGRDGQYRPQMVQISPGSFQMGSTNGVFLEQPVRPVTISAPFWISKYEVTQSQYHNLMGVNPSQFQLGSDSAQFPVENVSWNNAMSYCAQLTTVERALGRVPAGYEYRLPTEAEWEYCCRAGTSSEWHTGSTISCNQANLTTTGCSPVSTRVVSDYAPNAWGLHNMHGNVAEFCLDSWDGASGYTPGAATDPRSTTGAFRIVRGGAYSFSPFNCRAAFRGGAPSSYTNSTIGFRIVLAPVTPP